MRVAEVTGEALRTVLDEQQTVLPRDLGDRPEVRASAEQVRNDDDARSRGQRAFDRVDTGSECRYIEIYGHRDESVPLDDPGHVRMRYCRDQHFIPRR